MEAEGNEQSLSHSDYSNLAPENQPTEPSTLPEPITVSVEAANSQQEEI